MIQNATEVRLIHLFEILENSSDLESKAKFLQYLHKTVRINYSIHDFIAQGMALFQETDFEIG
jgi:hypothetical protein